MISTEYNRLRREQRRYRGVPLPRVNIFPTDGVRPWKAETWGYYRGRGEIGNGKKWEDYPTATSTTYSTKDILKRESNEM